MALYAFTRAVNGDITPAAAVAQVLDLTAAERDDQVATFLASSHLGEAPLQAFHSFVACVNGYAAERSAAPSKLNTVLLKSTIKWHVQLQRARRRTFITAVSEPDDISSFQGAVAAGHADRRQRFVRQSSTLVGGHRASVGAADAMPKRPSQISRQATQSAFAARLSGMDLDEDDEDEEGEGEGADGATKEGAEGAAGSEAAADALASAVDSSTPAAAAAAPGKMHRSVEMGQESVDDVLPLPPDVCGTFSCHGMDDNQGKINQDCACVAYPCNGDEEAALFVVLDGHGDLGDVVSGARAAEPAQIWVAASTRPGAPPQAGAPPRQASIAPAGVHRARRRPSRQHALRCRRRCAQVSC